MKVRRQEDKKAEGREESPGETVLGWNYLITRLCGYSIGWMGGVYDWAYSIDGTAVYADSIGIKIRSKA